MRAACLVLVLAVCVSATNVLRRRDLIDRRSRDPTSTATTTTGTPIITSVTYDTNIGKIVVVGESFSANSRVYGGRYRCKGEQVNPRGDKITCNFAGRRAKSWKVRTGSKISEAFRFTFPAAGQPTPTTSTPVNTPTQSGKPTWKQAHPLATVVSKYRIDGSKADRVFSRKKCPAQRLEDLLSTKIAMISMEGEGMIKDYVAPTHVVPNLKVIGYDTKPVQPDVARFFEPQEIGIIVKYHTPDRCYMEFDESGNPKELVEAVKIATTHIGMVVRVKAADGQDTAISINNPRDYEEGGFNGPDSEGKRNNYPSIMLRISLPDQALDQRKAYNDNIRTWAIITNTWSVFPTIDYNGDDPLITMDMIKIKQFGKWLMEALLGDAAIKANAVKELEKKNNFLYCAELVHVVVNLGINVPLNSAGLKALGVSYTYAQLKAKLAAKDQWLIKTKEAGGDGGVNPFIGLVAVNAAPESLRPLHQVLGVTSQASKPGQMFDPALALRPASTADLIERFIQIYVPRKKMHPVMQAEALKICGNLLIAKVSQIASEQQAAQMKAALDGLVGFVKADHGNDIQAFRAQVAKLAAPLKMALGPRPNGSGAFFPPNWFWDLAHSHAWKKSGKTPPDGVTLLDDPHSLLKLDVVGHAFHLDNLANM